MEQSMKTFIILLLIINLFHQTWASCEETESKFVNYLKANVFKYKCKNMSKEDFSSKMLSIVNAKKVRYLELININLSTINYNLFNDVNYRQVFDTLIINQCNVVKIEDDSFKMFDLTDHLKIINNNLQIFDGNVLKPMGHLDSLDLTNNNIRVIKLNCFNHKNFTELILNNNSLTSISSNSFIDCGYLKSLQIKYSKIETIEQGTFEKLKNLTYLDLSYNKLQVNFLINAQFINKLNYLDISYNKLNNFPCIPSAAKHSLIHLKLSHNEITIINNCTFQNMYSLKQLNLEYNKISGIQEDAFLSLKNLTYLDVSNNSLRSVNKIITKNLVSLQTLNISSNLLNEINIDTFFPPMKQLKNIMLLRNNWTCLSLNYVLNYCNLHDIHNDVGINKYCVRTTRVPKQYTTPIYVTDKQYTTKTAAIDDISIIYNDPHYTTTPIYVTDKQCNQFNNETFQKIVQNINSYKHILYLILFLIIAMILYKILWHVYQLYLQKQAKINYTVDKAYTQNELLIVESE